MCKTILTLEREKLKEKHNTPLTRPEPRLLFLDRSHKHSKTQGTDVTVLQPGALDANPGCREPASGPCLSFPICKWGAQGADGFLRCSHPQVLSSPGVLAVVTTLPRLGSPLRKAGGAGVSVGKPRGVGKSRLTSAGSAPRGPGRLRAGASNGPAPRPDGRRGSLRRPEAGEGRPRDRAASRSPSRPPAHSLTSGGGASPLPQSR